MSSPIAVCKTEEVDVILLQETFLTTGTKLKIAGYNAYTTRQIGTDKGLAILVRTTIPITRLHNPIPCGDNVETLAVTKERLTLLCGDFNAHHPILSFPSTTSPSGEHIPFALGELEGVTLLNTEQPTHLRGGRLDLTFATTAMRHLTRWQVHSTLVIDHFVTVTE
ncbi:uncharacterized protein [Palaemon carinicauda]|uniref:uncharacterized protein n=1 Tax=Palaemon carinicauda TaxID=392227 RepID=UPI0035B61D59